MISELLHEKNTKPVRQLDIAKFEISLGYGDSDRRAAWWFVLSPHPGGQEECEVCYQLPFE